MLINHGFLVSHKVQQKGKEMIEPPIFHYQNNSMAKSLLLVVQQFIAKTKLHTPSLCISSNRLTHNPQGVLHCVQANHNCINLTSRIHQHSYARQHQDFAQLKLLKTEKNGKAGALWIYTFLRMLDQKKKSINIFGLEKPCNMWPNSSAFLLGIE